MSLTTEAPTGAAFDGAGDDLMARLHAMEAAAAAEKAEAAWLAKVAKVQQNVGCVGCELTINNETHEISFVSTGSSSQESTPNVAA